MTSRFVAAIARGGAVGLVAAVALAATEWIVALQSDTLQIAGDVSAAALLTESLGRGVLTHVMVWSQVGAAIGLLTAWRRPGAAVVPIAAATLGALIAGTAVPVDLYAGKNVRGLPLIALCAAAVVFAITAYPLISWAQRRTPGIWRMAAVAALVSAVAVTGVTSVAFLRSPLVTPAAFDPIEHAVARPASERRNVLWIVLDTVRADRLGPYGYELPTTPFLDEFAATATVFEKAIADGTWTAPSHASMFTGLSVRGHGVGSVRYDLDARFPTTAQILQREGWATASFSNNQAISHVTQLDRGFQTSLSPRPLRLGRYFSLELAAELLGLRPLLPWFDVDEGGRHANHLVDRWLDDHAGDAPVFVFVNYMEAHLPWRVPERFRRMFLAEDELDRSYALRRSVYGEISRVLNDRILEAGTDFLTEPDREVLRKHYDAGIRYIDERVRELVGLFEHRGLLENTLVVITADHGEYLGGHDLWSHIFLAYNDLIHVPLLVRMPGQTTASRARTPVQLSDIHPTVLRVALGDAVEDAPGLLRLSAGDPRRIVVSEAGKLSGLGVGLQALRRSSQPRVRRLTQTQLTAQDRRFKYVIDGAGHESLYDLATDPGELRDVRSERRPAARRLRAALDRWKRQSRAPRPSVVGADPEVKEMLRGLGYVE